MTGEDNMIDLHMHTNYSDGTDTVAQLLQKAEQMHLSHISITDHNTCKAYQELKDKAVRKEYTGDIIPGVELNTKVCQIPIEILGYNIDIETMQSLLEQTYIPTSERNRLEVKRIYEKCKREGIVLPEDFVTGYDGTVYASKYLHNSITQNESNKHLISEASWNNSNVFYREYLSDPNSKFYVDMEDILPDFEKASSIIKQAGGLVFLPHIYEYRKHADTILQYILEHYAFDGIECYYRNFTTEQTEHLLQICKKRNLYVSGGSDYHGRNKKGVEIGIGEGNLHVPDECIENWRKISL